MTAYLYRQLPRWLSVAAGFTVGAFLGAMTATTLMLAFSGVESSHGLGCVLYRPSELEPSTRMAVTVRRKLVAICSTEFAR